VDDPDVVLEFDIDPVEVTVRIIDQVNKGVLDTSVDADDVFEVRTLDV